MYENETPEEKLNRVAELMKLMDITKSGYGGILSNGNIIDRRVHPEAIPMQKNSMFEIPKPKPIPQTDN